MSSFHPIQVGHKVIQVLKCPTCDRPPTHDRHFLGHTLWCEGCFSGDEDSWENRSHLGFTVSDTTLQKTVDAWNNEVTTFLEEQDEKLNGDHEWYEGEVDDVDF